jgi:hypothetical protein
MSLNRHSTWSGGAFGFSIAGARRPSCGSGAHEATRGQEVGTMSITTDEIAIVLKRFSSVVASRVPMARVLFHTCVHVNGRAASY